MNSVGIVRLKGFSGEERWGEREVEEAGLGNAEFVGKEGESGFGGVGFKRSEGLVKTAGKGGVTRFGNIESAGNAETEGIGWL
jgi:hypothetical protein